MKEAHKKINKRELRFENKNAIFYSGLPSSNVVRRMNGFKKLIARYGIKNA